MSLLWRLVQPTQCAPNTHTSRIGGGAPAFTVGGGQSTLSHSCSRTSASTAIKSHAAAVAHGFRQAACHADLMQTGSARIKDPRLSKICNRITPATGLGRAGNLPQITQTSKPISTPVTQSQWQSPNPDTATQPLTTTQPPQNPKP
jgi:hypothetical protein